LKVKKSFNTHLSFERQSRFFVHVRAGTGRWAAYRHRRKTGASTEKNVAHSSDILSRRSTDFRVGAVRIYPFLVNGNDRVVLFSDEKLQKSVPAGARFSIFSSSILMKRRTLSVPRMSERSSHRDPFGVEVLRRVLFPEAVMAESTAAAPESGSFRRLSVLRVSRLFALCDRLAKNATA